MHLFTPMGFGPLTTLLPSHGSNHEGVGLLYNPNDEDSAAPPPPKKPTQLPSPKIKPLPSSSSTAAHNGGQQQPTTAGTATPKKPN